MKSNIISLYKVFSVFLRKFPDDLMKAERFFSEISAEIVAVSKLSEPDEKLIRDIKDRPILRAAIQGNVDILVTGDKDFLDSGVTYPKIMTAAEFLNI
jgi:predicted nucleic acid-binding protein